MTYGHRLGVLRTDAAAASSPVGPNPRPSAGDAGCALRLQQHAGIAGAKPSAKAVSSVVVEGSCGGDDGASFLPAPIFSVRE
ncbi:MULTISPECIES: hypothetical protein [Xanthomonas]|uniref:Uncharacterized protein n=2 Tax=Xanthomonas TaxID=338 RepID=A0A9X9IJ00_XANCI|nr:MULTISPECIES: hypothetical protein [Xanthomonas]PPV00867.1 hypothetical protein XvhCFBP2543_20200 [Xanthomonas vasicola]WVK06387.1 hypothetical protein KWH09_22075 [Xanthomonas campestris pv. olitorii]MBV6787518.1 hypothetical protein [Xanthomonas campestris pv. uppalii]MBV6791731.1 hypothetical protein [Xanthomonas campestris pv. clerodendri]MBV6799925.1 hypothetical protein [Xanthomonas campestris pv. obscurae]